MQAGLELFTGIHRVIHRGWSWKAPRAGSRKQLPRLRALSFVRGASSTPGEVPSGSALFISIQSAWGAVQNSSRAAGGLRVTASRGRKRDSGYSRKTPPGFENNGTLGWRMRRAARTRQDSRYGRATSPRLRTNQSASAQEAGGAEAGEDFGGIVR